MTDKTYTLTASENQRKQLETILRQNVITKEQGEALVEVLATAQPQPSSEEIEAAIHSLQFCIGTDPELQEALILSGRLLVDSLTDNAGGIAVMPGSAPNIIEAERLIRAALTQSEGSGE